MPEDINFMDQEELNMKLENLRIQEGQPASSCTNEHKVNYAQNVSQSWIPPQTDLDLNFGFKPDVFQQQSFYFIKNHESILVTAHTGCGKTAIVEYAAHLCALNNTRMIYTSPLKALSNQKFYEFRKYNPGIITGDVSINNESNFLVMTTEILRNSLYDSNVIVQDLECVVFDEVHYITNRDRGVVWEECLIMLPPHVAIIMLGALIPNAMALAEWIGRVRNHKVYVITTEKRVVPLRYYFLDNYSVVPLFLENKNSKDIKANTEILRQEDTKKNKCAKNDSTSKGKFQEAKNFKATDEERNSIVTDFNSFMSKFNIKTGDLLPKTTSNADVSSMASKSSNMSKANEVRNKLDTLKAQKLTDIGKNKSESKKNIEKLNPFVMKKATNVIFEHIKDKKLVPAIFFCFSKRKCFTFAKNIAKPLLNAEEEMKVCEMCEKMVLSKLRPEERCISQIQQLLSMLRCGVGVHHSGLLPILKELVEILFIKRLVKIVFATETFSIGVNFPAKTVVFLGITKADSGGIRMLTSTEFMQISGRAGRRGIDEKGTVIVCQDPTGYNSLRQTIINLVRNKDDVRSKFKISYNMILDTLRCGRSVEEILKLSFGEDLTQREAFDIIKSHDTLSKFLKYHLSNSNNEDTTIINSEILNKDLDITKSTSSDYRNDDTDMYSIKNELNEISGKHLNSNDSFFETDLTANLLRQEEPVHVNFIPEYCCQKCNQIPLIINLNLEIRRLLSAMTIKHIKKDANLEGYCALTSNNILICIDSADQSNIYGKLAGYNIGELVEFPEHIQRILEKYNLDNISTIIRPKIKLLSDTKARKLSTKISDVVCLYKNRKIFTDFVIESLEDNIDHKRLLENIAILTKYFHTECPYFENRICQQLKSSTIQKTLSKLESLLSDENLVLYGEYSRKLSKLKNAKYISDDCILTQKGAVACEIRSIDTILATELLMNNSFQNCDHRMILCIFTSMISKEKANPDNFDPVIIEVRDFWTSNMHLFTNKIINFVFDQAIVLQTENVFFGSNYIAAVHSWIGGCGLTAIDTLHRIDLGSFAKIVGTLNEICREISLASKIIHDEEILAKIDQAQVLLRKDVAAFGSLYHECAAPEFLEK